MAKNEHTNVTCNAPIVAKPTKGVGETKEVYDTEEVYEGWTVGLGWKRTTKRNTDTCVRTKTALVFKKGVAMRLK